MNDIIFATKNLNIVTKDVIIALFDFLTAEGFNFDMTKMVWNDGTHKKAEAYHYIGILCNEWGGIVVHIPVKAWNSFLTGIQRSGFHLNEALKEVLEDDVLVEEYCGKTIDKESGFDGKVRAIPTIVWVKV